jgi:hypothetical protein
LRPTQDPFRPGTERVPPPPPSEPKNSRVENHEPASGSDDGDLPISLL